MGVYQALRKVWGRGRRAAFLAGAALVLWEGSAGAQLRLPRPTGYVNDFADAIPPEQERRIQQISDEVRAKSGGEIVVVTLPSLEGRSRDEVALQILREWGIGARGRPGDPVSNTGALVLVVPSERQLKIELGYGTNTFITAGEAGRIRDQYMVPAFRQGDFGGGILLAVTAIAQEYAERFDFELTGDVPDLRQARRRPASGGGNLMLFFVLAVILFMIFPNRGGRGGGGGGGRRRRGVRRAGHHPVPARGPRLRRRWLRRWRLRRRWLRRRRVWRVRRRERRRGGSGGRMVSGRGSGGSGAVGSFTGSGTS